MWNKVELAKLNFKGHFSRSIPMLWQIKQVSTLLWAFDQIMRAANKY